MGLNTFVFFWNVGFSFWNPELPLFQLALEDARSIPAVFLASLPKTQISRGINFFCISLTSWASSCSY